MKARLIINSYQMHKVHKLPSLNPIIPERSSK